MCEFINMIVYIGYQVSDLMCLFVFYELLGFQCQQWFSKLLLQGIIEVVFLEMVGVVFELYQFFVGMFFDVFCCGIDYLVLEVSDLDVVQQWLVVFGYLFDEGLIEEDNVCFLFICGFDGEWFEFDVCEC